MKLLNLGCGGNRRNEYPWINMDYCFHFLDPHVKECMEKEETYVDHDMLKKPWPFDNDEFEGIVASHVFEHFNCQDDLLIINECYRILKPTGILRISVPDPELFFSKTVAKDYHWGDKPEHENRPFMDEALFFEEHVQVLSYYGLCCMAWSAGFREMYKSRFGFSAIQTLSMVDSRPQFTLFMEAKKGEI